MLIHRISTTIFVLFLSLSSHALDLSQINLRYQYDLKNGLFTDHRVVDSPDGRIVFFDLKGENLSDWSATCIIQDKYNSEKHDTLVKVSVDTMISDPGHYMVKITLVEPTKSLLIVSLKNRATNFYWFHDVPIKLPTGFQEAYAIDNDSMPIIKNYLKEPQLVIDDKSRVHVYQYLDDFGPADPPMGLMKPIAPSLDIDSSFYFEQKLSEVKDGYFYLIQKDTLSESGLIMLKCPPYYPELKKIEELVGPLTYITTSGELNSIKGSMSKKAFEDFWINTYGTKIRAKSAIRYYYNQVEKANELFTDYKQGWKTDRGMIYIIYGLPDRVTRTERMEIWEYYDGPQFEFIRISTLFTPTMYSLKRDRKYEKAWYYQVGDLRKGM